MLVIRLSGALSRVAQAKASQPELGQRPASFARPVSPNQDAHRVGIAAFWSGGKDCSRGHRSDSRQDSSRRWKLEVDGLLGHETAGGQTAAHMRCMSWSGYRGTRVLSPRDQLSPALAESLEYPTPQWSSAIDPRLGCVQREGRVSLNLAASNPTAEHSSVPDRNGHDALVMTAIGPRERHRKRHTRVVRVGTPSGITHPRHMARREWAGPVQAHEPSPSGLTHASLQIERSRLTESSCPPRPGPR
jgi:hypothetical protein